jgi:hypothetical protein
MYKVLDVREHKYAVARSCGTGSNYSSSVAVTNDTHHEFVVICMELATKERKRFVFYDGHKTEDKFWGTHYYGYKGDFNLLVAGDLFEVEKYEQDYDRVILLS